MEFAAVVTEISLKLKTKQINAVTRYEIFK